MLQENPSVELVPNVGHGQILLAGFTWESIWYCHTLGASSVMWLLAAYSVMVFVRQATLRRKAGINYPPSACLLFRYPGVPEWPRIEIPLRALVLGAGAAC